MHNFNFDFERLGLKAGGKILMPGPVNITTPLCTAWKNLPKCRIVY